MNTDDRTPQERLHDAFCNRKPGLYNDEVLLRLMSGCLHGEGFDGIRLRHHTDIWNLPEDAALCILKRLPSLDRKRPSPALVLHLI